MLPMLMVDEPDILDAATPIRISDFAQ